MNIVLIGYRGVGKSVIGKILSKQLGMVCISTDAEIVDKEGMSISQIVETYGWSKFRELETEMIRKLSQCEHLIIDTGGGVIERPENVALLNRNAFTVWLKASVDTIVGRIHNDTQRPSLTAGKSFIEEIEDVLKQRIPKYKHAAKIEIATDNMTPEQVADKVIKKFFLHKSNIAAQDDKHLQAGR